jgi:hypothetical protein
MIGDQRRLNEYMTLQSILAPLTGTHDADVPLQETQD